MATLESLQKEIRSLKEKNNALEKRVSLIERMLDPQKLDADETQEAPMEAKAPSASDVDRPRRGGFEEAVGLKWLGYVGIFALVLGIGFFIKYAFDNNWVGHLGRIVIGALIGLGLVASGKIISSSKRFIHWGRTLIGGGFAILYFAVYSAYHFTEYREALGMTLGLDIALLTAVVVSAMLLSIKEDSAIIASEAFLLGFISALLSREFETLTLIYVLLLTIGVVIIVMRKRWQVIGIGGVLATYLIYAIWDASGDHGFILSAVFLSSYFICYALQSYFGDRSGNDILSLVTSALNSLLFALLSFILVERAYPDYSPVLLGSLGAISLLASGYLPGWLGRLHSYLGSLYLALFIPDLLDDGWVTVGWTLLAALLVVASSVFRKTEMRYSAYAVSLLTVLKGLLVDPWALGRASEALFHESTLFVLGIVILAFYSIARFLMGREEKAAGYAYLWSASLVLLVLLGVELKDIWISIGWTLLGITLLVFGMLIKERHLRLQGIIVFGITAYKVFFHDISSLSSFYKTISFIFLGVILLSASFLYAKYKEKIKDMI